MVSARLMPFKLSSCGLSDIGLVRQNNEDVWVQLPEDGFFLLADGMGGHQAGEVAAREAANVLCQIVQKKITPIREASSLVELKDLLGKAIRHVNMLIFKMSRTKQELRGMGTTLCCLLFHEQGLIYAHVGDSRIYRLRGHQLEQLTKDHSLLRELVDQGELDEKQALDFLYKNIITKAIGTEPRVEPSVETIEVREDDVFFMCSDGLSDLLGLDEIEDLLLHSPSLHEAAARLVACANEKGGRDNITVVLAKVDSVNASKDLSR